MALNPSAIHPSSGGQWLSIRQYWLQQQNRERAMNTQTGLDDLPDYPYVSTGHLPPSDEIVRLVDEAYQRYRTNTDGENSQVYPALAGVPSELFGICVVGTNGEVHAVGEADHEFSIMSVSKPFIFALVCEALG